MAAHACANLTGKKGNVVLGFSATSVYSMAIPYYNKTRAACGTVFIVVRNACSKVHAYTDTEITSLVPQAPSSFPSFAVHTASNEKLGGTWEQVLNVNQNPSCLWL